MPERSIYLAGKITKNGWRNDFVRGLRDAYSDTDYSEGLSWPILQDAIGPGLHYVGPFLVSDDHGCFHGANEHGFGAGGDACAGAYEPDHRNHGMCYYPGDLTRRESVVYRCLDAIDELATHVLAVIEDDAHGTLVELGYAVGKGKHVIVCPEVGPCTPFGARVNISPDPQAWFAFSIPGTRAWECCAYHVIEKWQRDAQRSSSTAKEEARCASPVELAFLREMRKDRALDRFLPNVEVMGGKYRIDFADIYTLVGVEIDGFAYHSDKDTFVKDRQRHRELDEIGWRLTRFSGSEVHHDAAGSVKAFKRWLNAIDPPPALPPPAIERLAEAFPPINPSVGRAILGGRARGIPQ